MHQERVLCERMVAVAVTGCHRGQAPESKPTQLVCISWTVMERQGSDLEKSSRDLLGTLSQTDKSARASAARRLLHLALGVALVWEASACIIVSFRE